MQAVPTVFMSPSLLLSLVAYLPPYKIYFNTRRKVSDWLQAGFDLRDHSHAHNARKPRLLIKSACTVLLCFLTFWGLLAWVDIGGKTSE